MGSLWKGGENRMATSPNAEYVVIFVAAFRHPKTKQIIRASDYGKKAFALKVRVKKKS